MADNWTVTNQRQTTTMVAGTFQDAMEVTFQTTDGNTGSVTVPLTSFTPDIVRNAIEARVQSMADVAAL